MEARHREVLIALIREYIDTAEPVGSRVLARRHFPTLSPATLRNAMADLEEMGYLTQPHTSAGRVPTDKAYRFYVDSFPPTTPAHAPVAAVGHRPVHGANVDTPVGGDRAHRTLSRSATGTHGDRARGADAPR